MLDTVKMIDLCKIAKDAGDQILKVYESEFAVETKDDKSPLTMADKKSHETIVSALEKQYPEVPILSEEGQHLSYEDRKQWEYFWLVDPLDGTKEFVKRNGEFTVNIALVHNGKPVAGVIYAPILDDMYIAKEGQGAFKIEKYSEVSMESDEQVVGEAAKLPIASDRKAISAVASRSHMSAETEEYVEKVKAKYGEVEITSAGSSLKLCLVAEGIADVYPRFAPTMEWDTGAGQAIVEQAGGRVVKVDNGETLEYNKENLLNPWFIVEKEGFRL